MLTLTFGSINYGNLFYLLNLSLNATLKTFPESYPQMLEQKQKNKPKVHTVRFPPVVMPALENPKGMRGDFDVILQSKGMLFS